MTFTLYADIKKIFKIKIYISVFSCSETVFINIVHVWTTTAKSFNKHGIISKFNTCSQINWCLSFINWYLFPRICLFIRFAFNEDLSVSFWFMRKNILFICTSTKISLFILFSKSIRFSQWGSEIWYHAIILWTYGANLKLRWINITYRVLE